MRSLHDVEKEPQCKGPNEEEEDCLLDPAPQSRDDLVDQVQGHRTADEGYHQR